MAIEIWHDGMFVSKPIFKYIDVQHINLNIQSLTISEIEKLMNKLGYIDVLGIGYNSARRYTSISV